MRSVFPEAQVHPVVSAKIGLPSNQVLAEVQAAIANHDVVVVGMAMNPHPGQARRALTKAGIAFHYLSYGSYLSRWRDRLSLKMWTGWPTFPIVFIKGRLVGGASDLIALIANGEIKPLLDAPRT